MSRFELKISKKKWQADARHVCVTELPIRRLHRKENSEQLMASRERERVRESANVIDKKKRIIIIIIVFIFLSEVRILYSPLIIVIQCSIFFSLGKSH